MEHALVRLAETAAWFFLVIFVFAAIGFIATIRWIVNLFTKTEQAAENEISSIERRL